MKANVPDGPVSKNGEVEGKLKQEDAGQQPTICGSAMPPSLRGVWSRVSNSKNAQVSDM